MSFVTPAQPSFNGGELSPRILARFDQNIRSIGVKRMHGWLPLLSGVAEACPGTLFVTKAKAPGARLIPFEYNVTQGYQIELGDGYARFFTNDLLIMDGDDPYEIATPWTLAQVGAVYFQQSLDVLYCAHPAVPLHVIRRIGADAFECVPYSLKNGPFDARNADRGVTVSASGQTGTVTIAAAAPIFSAGDVGRLIEIESNSFWTIKAWEAGMTVTAGQLIVSAGNVYQKTAGENRTGQVAPIHTEGTEYDGSGGKDVNDKGPYGAAWTYRHSAFGLAQIASFIDASTVTADVLNQLPTTEPCWRWSLGAFSATSGYPGVVGVWQERLILGKDASVFGSVAGALDDFATRNEFGDVSRDQAFRIDLPQADFVRWVIDDLALVVGTAKQEHVLAAASAGAGAGPGNIDRSVPSDQGASAARPVKVDGRAVFIQRARAKVVQLAYDTNRLLRAESPNLSRFADHIGAKGKRLIELAWAKEPERMMWARREDGSLAAMGFDPDEQFVAWSTRGIADASATPLRVSSISINTDPEGEFEQLWMVADDAESGEAWILRMAPIRDSGDTSEQVMLDAAVRRTGEASATVSAPHLAGRVVDICADGRPLIGVQLNAAGAAVLPFEAEDVIVGLPFEAQIVMPAPSTGSNNGPSFGKEKRPHRVDLHLINSDELEIGVGGATERINLLKQDRAFDQKLPLFSGRQQLEPPADYDRDMELSIRRVYPRPATLAIVMPFFESAQG